MVDISKNEFQPDYSVAPGDVLSYELRLRGMNQNELARRTGLTPKHIVAVIKGKSCITPETAIKLERAIGMPVEFWLNLEAQYQETLARQSEEGQLDKDLGWLERVPVKAMVKLKWIESFKEKRQQLVEVLQFFGIASVSQWDDVWPELPVAYRQHNAHEVFPEAVSAWLRKGELMAATMPSGEYNRDAFRIALDEIRKLTRQPPDRFVPAMQHLCARAGVAVVFVPPLPKTGVSGATRWLNPNKALIQLSLCYKTDDHLWFTFFHEAGHILLHGKKELFLEGMKGMDVGKENEANLFAQNELVPRKAYRQFVGRLDFSRAAIERFAQEVAIAPGIVVGQLQYETHLKFHQCNELKCRYEWAHD